MVELMTTEGVKIIRDTSTQSVEAQYRKFVNALKATGGYVHGSQSQVTCEANTNFFIHTIFIYFAVPKHIDIDRIGMQK